MWYKNRLRRHLCDMHIDDWSPEFLSKFDPQVYVDNLKKAKINSAFCTKISDCFVENRENIFFFKMA